MEASCENGDGGPTRRDDGDEDGNDLDDLPPPTLRSQSPDRSSECPILSWQILHLRQK